MPLHNPWSISTQSPWIGISHADLFPLFPGQSAQYPETRSEHMINTDKSDFFSLVAAVGAAGQVFSIRTLRFI